MFLRSWLCSLLVSVAAYGRLLLDEDGSLSRSRSRSLSPNQEKGMQVGMDVMDSAGLTLPPDSSSNSADPLSGFGEERGGVGDPDWDTCMIHASPFEHLTAQN